MRLSRFVLLVVLASAWLAAFGAPSASAGMKFANMTGAQEVPGPGDADGTGVAMLNLKVADGPGLRLPAPQQHRHADPDAHPCGAVGVAGPIVVNLTSVINGGCVTSPSRRCGRSTATRPTSTSTSTTATFPNGAIRGQLDSSLVSSAMPVDLRDRRTSSGA